MREKLLVFFSTISMILVFVVMYQCQTPDLYDRTVPESSSVGNSSVSNNSAGSIVELSALPEYTSEPYVEINRNVPFFTESDYTTESFERYSELDGLGRCGVAYANVSAKTMPDAPRGAIGSVKPSGWHLVKYDCIQDLYLYNRCHLIGYQLTGENANEKNLITGTRYFNVTGMLPFENQVASYVKATGNHVLYRVTPVFEGNDLVARGVLMEASSVEDYGKSLSFNVFVYNVQPQIVIDYATGESHLEQ